MAGRTPGLQQNQQSSEKSQYFKEKHNIYFIFAYTCVFLPLHLLTINVKHLTQEIAPSYCTIQLVAFGMIIDLETILEYTYDIFG